jgi:hypothetical protein
LPAVWREAKFSGGYGFAIPPYLKEGVKDGALALHLARHGDVEAALKLADAATAAQVKQHKLDRNYPLEWTRLVSLHLQRVQFSLAAENPDAGQQLVSLHRQLRDLLSEKAQKSSLGQALLPRGLHLLQQAAEAWKATKREAMARQAETWLAKFNAPAWSWPLPTERDAVARHLNPGESWPRGDGTPAFLASVNLRALDLSTLPVPHHGAEACWLFFEADDDLTELVIAYRPELTDYEQAAQWAPDLVARRETKPKVGVFLAAGNPYVGGVVQVQFAAVKPASLPRELGPLSLDRSFEQNRRLFAWKQRGDSIAVSDAKALAAVPLPTGERRPKQAQLEADATGDLLKQLQFSFASDNQTTLAAVAGPLWKALGPGKVEQQAGFELTWDDGRTRYQLGFPNVSEKSITLAVADSAGQDAAKRLAAAQARDLADRQARLKKNQPLTKLPRNLENFALRAPRATVERMIPASAVRRDVPQGVMAVFMAQPAAGDVAVRDLFARFNKQDQLVELRIRYFDVPGKTGGFTRKLEGLKASHGQGEALKDDASAFADLPTRPYPFVHLRWQDDLTCLTAQSDGGALELTLRDCPPTHAEGTPLPPFTFLARGPQGIDLGTARSEVLKQGAVPAGDALLVELKKGPYDSLLVWFDGEQASRIVARTRRDSAVAPQPAKVLPETWARDVKAIGWPWRQDFIGKTPQSWTTFDERTRYRLFWQEDNNGTHLLVEWKDLPR